MISMTYLYIALGVIVPWIVFVYNSFIRLRYRVREAMSDIDIQLKRRYDLIPNLIETVKGYMAHEKDVLEKVTQARSRLVTGGMMGHNPLERAGAENDLSTTLRSLFAIAESYPDLKANTNFLELQRELADTENKIQAARRFYNSTVMALNNKTDSFPSNIIASMFDFKKEKFFEVMTEHEKEPVQVKF